MQKQTLSITYSVYQNLEDLPAKDRDLALRAQQSQAYSYAPYSRFKVGAALQLEDGQIIGNGNQENAAYSLCLCAERSVLASARYIAPDARIEAIAVSANALHQMVSPCGACRQVLHETEIAQGHPIRIILQGPTDTWLVLSAAQDLLPLPFGPENLKP